MPDPTIDVVVDVTTVLDSDEAALNAQQADLQSQIDTINAQIASLQAQVTALQAQSAANAEGLFRITLIRTYVAVVASDQAAGSFLVPAAPPPTGTPEPVTPGITTS